MHKKASRLAVFLLSVCLVSSITTTPIKAEGNGTSNVIPKSIKEGTSRALDEKRTKLKEEIDAKKETVKKEVLEKIQEKVTTIIEKRIRKLERIKKRVSNMAVISDELKTELNSKVNEKIAVLNKIEKTVQRATTKEELLSAMNSYREELKNTKNTIQDIVEAIHKTHLTNIIEKIEAFIPKAEKEVDGISDISLKKEAEELISSAKAQLKEAKTQLASGNLEDARKTIKEAFRNIKYALGMVNDKEVIND